MDLFGIKKRRAAKDSDNALEQFHLRNYKEAEDLALMAAKSGCLDAIDHIIACYYTGEHVIENLHTALRLSESAIPLGSVLGAYVAAYIYFYGVKANSQNEEIPVNYEYVYKYASISINEPKYSGFSAYYLAELYAYGNYVEKDLDKAFSLYKTASDTGFIKATVNLARCYRLGYGTQKDEDKCFELLTKAHKAKPGSADFELGMLHQYSKGKFYSPEKAIQCFLKSGGSTANSQINKILDALTEEQLLNIGNIFDKGLGVPKDPETAYKAYRKALDKNNLSIAFRWLLFHDLNNNPYSEFVEHVLSEKDSSFLEFVGGCLMTGLKDELNKNESQAIRFFRASYEKYKNPDTYNLLVNYYLDNNPNDSFLDDYYDEKIAKGELGYWKSHRYGCNLIYNGINKSKNKDTVIKGVRLLTKIVGNQFHQTAWEHLAKGCSFLADSTGEAYWINEARYWYAGLSEKSLSAENFEKFVHYSRLIQDDTDDYVKMLVDEIHTLAESGNTLQQSFLEEQYRLGKLLPLDPVKSSYWCKKLIDSKYDKATYTLEYANRLLTGYGVKCDIYEAEKYLSRYIDDDLYKYKTIYTAADLLPVWGQNSRRDLILKWADAASKLNENHESIKKVFFIWRVWAETPGTYIYALKINSPELKNRFMSAKLTEIYGQNYNETAVLYKQLADEGHGEAAYRLTIIYNVMGTANNAEKEKYLDIAKRLGYPSGNSFADYLTRIVSGDIDAFGDLAIFLARDATVFREYGGQIHKDKYYVTPLVDIGLEHLTAMANKGYPKYKFDLSEFYAYKLRQDESLEEYWTDSAIADGYAPALLAGVNRDNLPYYKQSEYARKALNAGLDKANSYLKRIDQARQIENNRKADYNNFVSSLRHFEEITRSFELDIAESEFNKQIFGYNETFSQMAENGRLDLDVYWAISNIREKHMDNYRSDLKKKYPNK